MIPQFKELVSPTHSSRNAVAETPPGFAGFDAAMAKLDEEPDAATQVDVSSLGLMGFSAQAAPRLVSPPEKLLEGAINPMAGGVDADLTRQPDTAETGVNLPTPDAMVLQLNPREAGSDFGSAEAWAVSAMQTPVRAEYALQIGETSQPKPAIGAVQTTPKPGKKKAIDPPLLAHDDSPKLAQHLVKPLAAERSEKRHSRVEVVQVATMAQTPDVVGEKPDVAASARPSDTELGNRAIQAAASRFETAPVFGFAPQAAPELFHSEAPVGKDAGLVGAAGEHSVIEVATSVEMAEFARPLMPAMRPLLQLEDVKPLAETPKAAASSLESAWTLRIGDQTIDTAAAPAAFVPAEGTLVTAAPDANRTSESRKRLGERDVSTGQPIEIIFKDSSFIKTADGVNAPIAFAQMPQPTAHSSAPKELAVPGQTPIPKLPPTVSGQLVHHSEAAKKGGVEVLLAPAELGHVKFQIHQQADSVRLVISAERSDTLDLLRRNSEQLLQEFKQAGFSGASLSFGDWSQQGKSSPMPAQTALAFDEDFVVAGPAPRAQSTSTTSSSGQGLDLRL